MAPLSPQLFALLTSLVEERSGLHYATSDLPIFSEKVGARLAEAGFETPLDYYYFLRYDASGEKELAALVDALVVNETYLFRELDAVRASMEHVLRPAIRERGRARVWSAGCSTGDEPFTIAMLAADQGLLDRLDILATDVSATALARARLGVLPSRSLRALSKNAPVPLPPVVHRIAERWLVPQLGGGAEVSRTIVDAVDFRQESLLEPHAARLGELDLILCRNVLIYFRDEVLRRVVEMLSERLRPDGRLVVGASESLMRFGTMLRCEERAGAFLYTKDPSRRDRA